MRFGLGAGKPTDRPEPASIGVDVREDDQIRVDATTRLWPWFNLLFAALTLLSIVLVLADEGSSWTRRLVGLPILAGCVIAYLRLVRPVSVSVRPIGWRRLLYPGIAIGSVVALVSIHNSFWFFSLVVFFQLWMLLPLRAAAPASAGLSLFLWAHGSLADGDGFRPSFGAVLIFLSAAAVSTMLGVMIAAIARQSGQRLDLIRQLEAERLARLEAEREAGALAERARLSRDLHDTLAQGFTSIVMHLEAADAVMAVDAPERRPVADARRIARENLGEVRRLVWALRPTQLPDADLSGALDRMVQSWSAEQGVAATFRLDGGTAVLPPAVEVTLLRIAQEALTNIQRHAGATMVDVVLTVFDEAVHLDVRDDGRGFDPDVVSTPGGLTTSGYGLPGIRERVAALGGTVEIESVVGGGSILAVALPLQSGRASQDAGPSNGGQPVLKIDQITNGAGTDALVAETVRWPARQEQQAEGGSGI